MLRLIVLLSAMVAMVTALSVEVNIKGPQKGACKGVITFVALDSDCGDCLYGVKDFHYATVKCRTQAAAEQCCKTVTKTCTKRMSYNNNRRNQSSPTSSRIISYNSGGLNERFSKIVKSATSTRSPVAVHNNNTTNDTHGSGSVFSRLRGAKPNVRGRIGATNIQNRLGKTNSGGIKKRGGGGPTPMQGVERQRGKVGKRVVGKKQTVVKSKQGNKGSQQQKKKKKETEKKPATADDLDRALDAYMMKDPKTAQAKLDAEITSYMDEAGDILMGDAL